MSGTFAERCAESERNIPGTLAPVALINLHTDMLAEIARLTAEVEALRKDAERYRFPRADFSVGSLDIDGKHAWAYRRNFSLRGPTLDAAIDATKEQA